jgi:hypothetical protein
LTHYDACDLSRLFAVYHVYRSFLFATHFSQRRPRSNAESSFARCSLLDLLDGVLGDGVEQSSFLSRSSQRFFDRACGLRSGALSRNAVVASLRQLR